MSNEGEPKEPIIPTVKKRLADKIAGGAQLPDDLRLKVKELAQAQGKSEQEVLQELVTTGLASSNDDIMIMLARKRVLSSITLDEAEIIMKKIGNVFGTWSTTPQPIITQKAPSTQPLEQKDELSQIFDKIEKDAMKGLPPVTYEQGKTGVKQPQSLGTVMLYGLGKYALKLLLENEHIGKSIGKLIEEKGEDFMKQIDKWLKEGEKEE